jgi:hypothetical protein
MPTHKGGRRKGSGRKPVADKREQVSLYIRKSIIISQGGKDEVKRKIMEFLADVD